VADKCKPYTLFKGYLLKSSVRCNPLVAIVFRCVAANCTHVLLCGNNLLCAQVHTVAMKPTIIHFPQFVSYIGGGEEVSGHCNQEETKLPISVLLDK
jgi:hypothetical protein